MNIFLRNLTKSYNDKTVLQIDKLHINQSSSLGIIGPNGAGKSTLARIIAGLDKASTGNLLYNNSPLDPDILQNMTMVFQHPYLLRTSVFNNIAYPLKIRKTKANIIKSKVSEMLKQMEIENIKDQNAWTLSGGEAQKVALARAIIFEPSILILDEPSANIDPSSIFVMEKAIKNFHLKSKATIIIVTHNLNQAKRLCSYIAFMHQGEVIEYDKTANLFLSPKNQLTKGFLEGEIIL